MANLAKYTKEEFVRRASLKHGGKYNYDKVDYVDSQTKVEIICPVHGCFTQRPAEHLRGNGCPKCSPSHKMGNEEFVIKAKEKHLGKYDYSLVDYIDSKTKVKIICPIHGVFEQSPSMHLQGQGCPRCKDEKTSERFGKKQDMFIKQALDKHGDKFNYSKVQYKDTHTKVCIICNHCGREFLQTPHNHIEGQGCPWCSGLKKDTKIFKDELFNIYGERYNLDDVIYVNAHTPVRLVCNRHGAFEKTPKLLLKGFGCACCGRESTAMKLSSQKRYTTEDSIKVSNEKHCGKYDYSESKYIDSNKRIYIICPIHGGFWQIAGEHMRGAGCPKCKGYNKTTEEFKEQLRSVHGDTFILDKVEYINASTKVCVVCRKHGDFFATPSNLLRGCGCPQCNKRKGEERVERYLKDNKINYISQYEIPNESLLIPNKVLRIDFYIPNLNTFIEYNGGQHYFPVEMFGGQKTFEKQQERDYVLRLYCKEHGINLIEIPYDKYNKIEEIISKNLPRRGKRH